LREEGHIATELHEFGLLELLNLGKYLVVVCLCQDSEMTILRAPDCSSSLSSFIDQGQFSERTTFTKLTCERIELFFQNALQLALSFLKESSQRFF